VPPAFVASPPLPPALAAPPAPDITPASRPEATPERPLKDQPGRHLRGVPVVEGGEGAAFAGEDMWPANLTRGGTLPIPAGET